MPALNERTYRILGLLSVLFTILSIVLVLYQNNPVLGFLLAPVLFELMLKGYRMLMDKEVSVLRVYIVLTFITYIVGLIIQNFESYMMLVLGFLLSYLNHYVNEERLSSSPSFV